MSELPSSARRVMQAASAEGLDIEMSVMPEGTKTAQAAADAIGCDVGAIVKSLVFTVDGEPVVALVAGDRRLDTSALAELAGGEVAERASLELVREATGYAAGGTPPFGHARPLRVFADESLGRYDVVWAGGGTPSAVFPISVADLDRVARPLWGAIGV